MKLFKLIFEIRYPEDTPDIYLYRERIIRAVAKDKGKKIVTPDFTEGFEFTIKQKSAKVAVQNKRMSVDIIFNDNLPNQIQFAQDNIIKIIKVVNGQLQVKRVQRIGVRSIWFREVNVAINQLIQKYKSVFFRNNPIVDKSTDVALAFTLENRDRKINYNSGPMDIQECNNFIKSNLNSMQISESLQVSNPVIFFDFDYYLNKSMKFSEAFFTEFVNRALTQARENLETTTSLLA